VRIIRPTDTIAVDHPLVVIVGQPGIGKSTLGYAFNTLLLDFDQGAHRVAHRGATGEIAAWADARVTRELLAGFDGVTVDTVERAIGMLALALIDENPNYGYNGSLYPKGWGVAKQRFALWLDGIRALGDTLLLAHAKDVRDGERRYIRADIPGGSYGEIYKRADFVGYLSMVGGRRVLDFSPTDQFIGKNPGGWPPIVLPPAERIGGFMAELFEAGRLALGTASAEGARIAREVATWQRSIGAYITGAHYSAGLEALRAIKADDPAVYAQAHHVLAEASRAAGMRYQAGVGFVATGVRPPVAAPRVILHTARAATWQPGLLSELTRERAS
jgi:hypothetical protein